MIATAVNKYLYTTATHHMLLGCQEASCHTRQGCHAVYGLTSSFLAAPLGLTGPTKDTQRPKVCCLLLYTPTNKHTTRPRLPNNSRRYGCTTPTKPTAAPTSHTGACININRHGTQSPTESASHTSTVQERHAGAASISNSSQPWPRPPASLHRSCHAPIAQQRNTQHQPPTAHHPPADPPGAAAAAAQSSPSSP